MRFTATVGCAMSRLGGAIIFSCVWPPGKWDVQSFLFIATNRAKVSTILLTASFATVIRVFNSVETNLLLMVFLTIACASSTRRVCLLRESSNSLKPWNPSRAWSLVQCPEPIISAPCPSLESVMSLRFFTRHDASCRVGEWWVFSHHSSPFWVGYRQTEHVVSFHYFGCFEVNIIKNRTVI